MTGHVIWITGLSGAGKTTLAEELNTRLQKKKTYPSNITRRGCLKKYLYKGFSMQRII